MKFVSHSFACLGVLWKNVLDLMSRLVLFSQTTEALIGEWPFKNLYFRRHQICCSDWKWWAWTVMTVAPKPQNNRQLISFPLMIWRYYLHWTRVISTGTWENFLWERNQKNFFWFVEVWIIWVFTVLLKCHKESRTSKSRMMGNVYCELCQKKKIFPANPMNYFSASLLLH